MKENKKMKTKQFQQGDCVLKTVSEFPKGDREQDALTQSKTLALGEATGHHHTFAEADLDSVEVFKILNKVYINALKPVCLEHQEHKPIVLPPGKYELDIVKETDWLTRVTRRVSD